MSLNFFFNPESVAIVGVSIDSNKLGSVVFNNMLKAGFSRNIYPVNPKYSEVYGHKCYSKVSDIDGCVDLICIVVPPEFVLDVLTDGAKKEVKGAIIITAGFGESSEEWPRDSSVKVIGEYLEDLESGRELTNIYANSKVKKPLIVFKPGESDESRSAISSHTGSLAGSFEVFDTAMRQAGITIARDIDNMFNLLLSFSWSKIPKGRNIAIITNAGGPGIIATDFIIKNELKLARLSIETQSELKSSLPANASVSNPVDLIGDADSNRYKKALEVLIKENEVDAILVLLTPQIVTDIENTAKVVINAINQSPKPIIPIFLGGKYVSFGLQKFYDEKIPAFRDISEAIETLSSLVTYYETSEDKESERENTLNAYLNKGRYKDEVSKYLANKTTPLPEDLVSKLALEVGIELPKQLLSTNILEAIEFAKDKYPVVLKATTDVIAHKTDKKALYLNILNEEMLRDKYSELENMIKSTFNISSIELLIQEQINFDEEIFIGANRDGERNVYDKDQPGFGHLLAFGKGGIYTEIYKDIGYSLAPSNREDILKNLEKTKIYKIIQGARGKKILI